MSSDGGHPGELVPSSGTEQSAGAEVSVSDWYWVSEEEGEWLGCAVHVGSNFVLFKGPVSGDSYNSERVLLSDLDVRCRREPCAPSIIAAKIAEQRAVIADAVKKLGATTERLGLADASPGSETQSLVLGGGGASVREYEKSLVAARSETLPELEAQIKEAAVVMKAWMQAESYVYEGQQRLVKRAFRTVDDRIAGVEIYAGLAEQLVQIQGGPPAGEDEPLHLFQRRLYMDEECLANYDVGGMTFDDLPAFDRWLLLPQNLARIMPRPRSAVTFRIRRNEREDDDNVLGKFVKMVFDWGRDDSDKRTLLYLRNGDQVYRLETQINFGEKFFPDADRSILRHDGVWAMMFAGKVDRLATEGEHRDMLRRQGEDEDNFRRDWEPWSSRSVYYDDITEHVKKMLADHNRVVLLLQGIYDRAQCLHPHPPCRLWLPEDFARSVRLVFDDDRALSAGPKPDFEAYRRASNQSLRRGSLTVGQEDFWLRLEAEREREKNVRKYGDGYQFPSRRYRPNGDPGPGVVAQVVSMSSGKDCTFRWESEGRRRRRRWDAEPYPVKRRVRVPASELLCVEGYRPGDYHKFYDDPRTRAEYVRWVPLLLRAEEWHAGLHRCGGAK